MVRKRDVPCAGTSDIFVVSVPENLTATFAPWLVTLAVLSAQATAALG